MTDTQVFDAESQDSDSGQPESLAPGELMLGTLVALDEQGQPMIRLAWGDGWHQVKATPAVAVTRESVGRQAVVMFAGGQIQSPVLLGFVHSPLNMALESDGGRNELAPSDTPLEAEVDGGKTLVEGREQVVLRCGAASITLTESGKIILRGQHLVSRSSGVNRILGASIQMN